MMNGLKEGTAARKIAAFPIKPSAGGTPATLSAPIKNEAPTSQPRIPVVRKSIVLLNELIIE
jgi:hypothetical protein